MSTGGRGQAWHVELSCAAARTLRRLDRPAQRALGRHLDRLVAEGPPHGEAGPPDSSASRAGHRGPAPAARVPGVEGPDGSRAIVLGDHVALCRVRPGARRVTVLSLQPVPAAPARRLAWLDELALDLKVAVRGLGRNPGFTALTVLILALGIGGNSALFGVVRNVFLGALPFRDADSVVRLRDHSIAPDGTLRNYNMAPRNLDVIRRRAGSFEAVVGQLGTSFTVTGDGDPERLSGVYVSPGWAGMLGIEPRLGSLFTAAQEEAGRDAAVALIGHGLWQRRFGGDPDVIGASLLLDGLGHTIVGVLQPGFRFPYDAEVWVPGRFDAADGRSHDLNVLARLREGVTLAAARSELEAIAADLRRELADFDADQGLTITPARENFIADQDRTVLGLAGAVFFFLVLTGVNVSGLLTARNIAREPEIAVRAALGAGRGRQLRGLLVETGLLFGAGGLGALLLTAWLADRLTVLVPDVLRDQLDLGHVGVDGTMVAFTLALSALGAVVFGGVAAWRASRADLAAGITRGSRASDGRRHRNLQRALVVAQVSLAVILLSGAAVMVQHFRALQAQELGFDPEGLLTLRIDLRGSGHDAPAARSALVTALEEAIAATPGVVAVGTTTVNPICCGDWGAVVEMEGVEPPAEGSIIINHRFVSPSLHEAMGIRLLRGRLLTDDDTRGALPVVVVDRRMVEHFWPGEDPLGRRVRLANRADAPWHTVVGVVETVQDAGDYTDTWYLPYHQDPTGRSSYLLHLMVRLSGDRATTVAGVRAAVAGVDPDLALYGVAMMDGLRAEGLSQDRLGAVVAAVFAVFGLGLAGTGIYGLMTYLVRRQVREIGTRLALGASPGGISALVLGRTLRLVVAGALLGAAGSVALGRLLEHLVPGAAVADPLLLVALPTILVAAALAAAWLPARRAARTDPALVLRDGG